MRRSMMCWSTRRFLVAAVVSVVAGGLMIPARAGTVSATLDLGVSSPTSGDFSIPQFDPTLGTLTSIDLALSGTASSGAIVFYSERGEPETFTLTTGLGLNLAGTPGLNVHMDASEDVSTNGGENDYPSITGRPDSTSFTITNPVDLGSYIGTDRVRVREGKSGDLLFTARGFSYLYRDNIQIGGIFTYTYNYTPSGLGSPGSSLATPEPASMILCLVATGATLGYRVTRRRRLA